MKKISAIFILVFITLGALHAQDENKKEIIGYYPNWQLYKRGRLCKPENVDYSKYTILNYSFFYPNEKGDMIATDDYADDILLTQSPTVVELAHTWGVKVMVSLGGWTLSETFPAIAADEAKRKHFAEECVRMLKTYKFDGIDIDWEYPGYTEHKGTADDKHNFTLMMKELRRAIDEYGEEINYKFLLTGAFGAARSHMDNIEWDEISKTLDYINLMTYDFNGPWSEEANHNSPLYAPEKGSPGSLDYAFKLITEEYGVPAEKVNLGVAFYGRSLVFPEGEAKLFGETHLKKQDMETYWALYDGSPLYYAVLDEKHNFEEHWDDVAKVPYLISKDGTIFCSYDNEKSVRMKGEYIMEKGAAGAIIWDATGDYVETSPGSGFVGSTPLADALAEALNHKPGPKIKKRWK